MSTIISRIINFRINLIGCKKCEFKCTDRRYLSAHNRIEHRLQNENVEEENFIEKLIIIVKETSEHTELIMESLLEKAQGLVEELIDFKSAFPKCLCPKPQIGVTMFTRFDQTSLSDSSDIIQIP